MRKLPAYIARLAVALLVVAALLPACAFADGTQTASGMANVSADATSALLDGAQFGIGSFVRRNKGTNKNYNDTYYGYRYTMADSSAFACVVCDGYAIVYIPADVALRLGIKIDDAAFQQQFEQMLVAIDYAASHGGPTLQDLQPEYIFTSQPTYEKDGYTYAFAVEVESGYYYATVTQAGSADGSDGAIYAETGDIQSAGDTTVVGKKTGLAALQEFFGNLDWRPLWVSLKTAGVGMLFVFFLGLLAAWGTVKVADRWKGLLDTIFTIPMVLPPTVCGFLLLMLFGTSTAAGRWFIAHGINIVFTWPAAVIACVVVSFPLMYRTARGAFEGLDSSMLDAARTLGWSEGKVFIRLMLPLAWPSIAAGTVLAFARAMGEFGATLFFAGNYVGITQTIPIAIYFDWMAGSTDVAIFWVIVVILISFLVILFINIYSSHTQKYRTGANAGSGRVDEE